MPACSYSNLVSWTLSRPTERRTSGVMCSLDGCKMAAAFSVTACHQANDCGGSIRRPTCCASKPNFNSQGYNNDSLASAAQNSPWWRRHRFTVLLLATRRLHFERRHQQVRLHLCESAVG